MDKSAPPKSAPAGEVWVYVELTNGRPAEVSLELLGKARELAAELATTTAAVVIGPEVSSVVADLAAQGAQRVYTAQHPALTEYLAAPHARIVAELIRRCAPQIVLYGATTTGRDLAPRVASTLRTGLTADCTDLKIGDHRTKERAYHDLLYQIRPAFGGNIIATIVAPDHRPQMATVREGVFRLHDPDLALKADTVSTPVLTAGDVLAVTSAAATDTLPLPFAEGTEPIWLQPEDFRVQVLDREQHEKKVDLKGARIIVSGGAGVGSAEGFGLIADLAHTIGGVVGASRAAVDAGWIARDHQVGQTGTTVRPKLYIAAGISGSVQHRAGMSQSARILAINTDPSAPIFSVAHYGIVGDLFDVIPRMIRAYRSKA